MKNTSLRALCLCGMALGTGVAFGQQAIVPAKLAVPPRVEAATPPKPYAAETAIADEESTESGSSLSSVAASPLPAAGTKLTPPVTITYAGSSNAVAISDSGTGRGVSSSLTNSKDPNSAVYGETVGKGAGVKGINSGALGSAGVFQITDSANAQPAMNAATSGIGPAVLATVTNDQALAPAILGESTTPGSEGAGVEGVSINTGVVGMVQGGKTGSGFGVYGYNPSGGIGAEGNSPTGVGVEGISTSSYGAAGISQTGSGIYAASVEGSGIVARSHDGAGLYATSDNLYAVYTLTNNQFGVVAIDTQNGTGVYGQSDYGAGIWGHSEHGYAGYFDGPVGAKSYVTLSDKNQKTGLADVDGSVMLERIAGMPISSWAFKGDLQRRHVGPMAQDFHAAFGLNGEDDKHINLGDAAGVSLVAIQELTKRLKQKDAQLAEMQARLEAMTEEFSKRVARLEQHVGMGRN